MSFVPAVQQEAITPSDLKKHAVFARHPSQTFYNGASSPSIDVDNLTTRNGMIEMKRGSLGAPTLESVTNITIMNTVRTEDGDDTKPEVGGASILLPKLDLLQESRASHNLNEHEKKEAEIMNFMERHSKYNIQIRE